MSKWIKYIFLLLACPVFGQSVVFTAGVNYTSGAPTHNPGKANSRIAIDTVTWLRYEHVVGTTWTATGYAWQEHSGCTAPSATPTKHESIYKTNTCSPPKMYKWTGAAWEEMGGTGSAVITASNALYKPTSTSVKVGGPLVENTNINGKATYTLTLDSMYLVTIKANRTSGTGASRMTMGTTNLIGVDIVHYNPADLDNIGQITANFNTGNIMSLANGSLITSFTQYLSGGNYRSEWYASNGSSNRILSLGYDDFTIQYLDRQGIAENTAFTMWDTITGKLYYQSPDLMGAVFNRPDSTWAKGSLGSPSYAGKTIGSAVWRYGRTGFKTTSTTGVLNIMPGFETGVPAISIPDSCEQILNVAADSRGDSLGAFVFHNRWFDNASEVGDNQVAIIGYNTAPGGGKIESGKAGASLRIEEKYDISADGNKKPSFEFHLPQINFKTGTGNIRPLTGLFGHEQRFGGRWQFASDDITFLDYKTGTSKVVWGFGENGYTKGIDFQDTAQLRFAVNNWNIFTQRNAAGTGFVNVVKVDNSNQILLGGGGESRVAAYNHLRITNSGLLSNELGEIYIGNTANPTRVILEHNTSNLLTLARTGATYTNTFSIFGSQFYFQSSGGTAPFNVDLGAPSNSLVVRGSGSVGIGTFSPQKQMHLYSTGGASTGLFRIENSTGSNDIFKTNATPEGAITGVTGDLAIANISGVGSLWIKKETSGGTTGWAKAVTGIEDKTINTYFREVALPTAVNNTVYLGVISLNGGGGVGHAEIIVSAEDGGTGVAITKEFIFPAVFSATSGNWQTMLPTSSTGNRLGEDFSLEVRSASAADSLRVRRTAGTSSTNIRASIIFKNTNGLSITYFTPITKTWNGPAVPSTVFNYNSYTAEKNKFGVMTAAPAQTFHVEGTARITGSDGTATTIAGRDADGDISSVSLGSSLALSSGTLAIADVAVTPGTYGNHNKFVEIDVNAKGQITDIVETAFNITTYASSGGPTTTTLQHDDYIVEADPTAGDLTIELGSQENGRVYHIFGCCNLTNDIILSGSNMKFTGAYGVTSSPYTLGAGEHLEIIYRSSNSTYYISKK